MVKRETIIGKILYTMLSGILLFSLAAVALLPQTVSASPGEDALLFDGVNDYVNCGNNASLDLTTALTLEVWVKWTFLSNSYPIIKGGNFPGVERQ
jgi:hypothetical protein